MSASPVLDVPVVTGPTAAGKTGLAMALADALPQVRLISADSVMVYRGMDIGSGKPSPEELARHPHELVDIRDPAKPYSAARFADDAADLIRASWAEGRVPLLVGGTLLYLRALMFGLSTLPSADPAVRETLQAEADRDGWPALHQRLAEADPVTAARIHPRDGHRIQRALEIVTLTGQGPSELHQRSERPTDMRFHLYAVAPPDRATLHRRIAARFDGMLAAGLVDEVAGFFHRSDLSPELPAFRAVGYRQVWQYLAGAYDDRIMVERALAATRQLAKRQYTWLRKTPKEGWFDVADPGTLGRMLNSVKWNLKL